MDGTLGGGGCGGGKRGGEGGRRGEDWRDVLHVCLVDDDMRAVVRVAPA